jgi:hypothetical protein
MRSSNSVDSDEETVRLPLGTLAAVNSSYLSLISLVKSWPQPKVRREVLMVADGIDRLRGETPTYNRLGPNYGTVHHSMPTMSPDVNSASEMTATRAAMPPVSGDFRIIIAAIDWQSGSHHFETAPM